MSGKKRASRADKKTFKQFLDELKTKHDGDGTDSLSKEERCMLLEKIYDTTLLSLYAAVTSGINAGTSAAVHILERTRLEVMEIQRAHGKSESNNMVMAYEYELPFDDDKKDAQA